MNKLIINVWEALKFNDDMAALIVLSKTGIYWTDQSAGIACNHPEVEGFMINWSIWDCELDCKYLCGQFSGDDRHKESYLTFFNDEKVINELAKVSLELDKTRMNECQENWIPVLANIKTNAHDWNTGEPKKMKCIYTSIGNCD